MASIRFSAVGGEIKGKINGTAFQGGKSGPTVKRLIHRSFVRVLAMFYGSIQSMVYFAGQQQASWDNRKCYTYADGQHNWNPRKTNQRVELAKMASNWKKLTAEQRTAWNASAVNFPFKNRFGDVYTGSGFQVFMELNMNLVSINEAYNVFPPNPTMPFIPQIKFPDGESDDPLLFLFPFSFYGDQSSKVFISPPQRPGMNTKGANPKLIAVLNGQEITTSVELLYLYQKFYGPILAGTNIEGYIVAVGTNNGVASSPLHFSIGVTAGVTIPRITSSFSNFNFGNVPVDHESETFLDFKGVNLIGITNFSFIGANANLFTLALTNDGNFQPTRQWVTDQYGNMVPNVATVHVTPAVLGPFTATLRIVNSTTGAIKDIILTGNAI